MLQVVLLVSLGTLLRSCRSLISLLFNLLCVFGWALALSQLQSFLVFTLTNSKAYHAVGLKYALGFWQYMAKGFRASRHLTRLPYALS